MLSGLCSIPKMVIESTSARFAILSHMSDYQHISHGFEPVFDDRSRILVLGSFPSVQSRKNAFYYGNPQNRFWRVMAACLGEPVPPNEGEPMATTPSPAGASAYRDTTTEQILPPTSVNGIHRAATPKWGEASSTKTAAQGEGPANRASLAESIAAKKQLPLAHGIALWDVIESCDIKGSSDASIKNVVPAQVERVLETARIGAVVCNGGTAGRLYKRYLQWQVGLAAHVLPSTSPANAQWGLNRLTERWHAELAPLLAAAADGTLGEALPQNGIKRSFVTAKVQVKSAKTEVEPSNAKAEVKPTIASKLANKGNYANENTNSTAESANGEARGVTADDTAGVPIAAGADEHTQKRTAASPRVQYATVRVEAPAASSWSVHKSMQGNKRANTKPELVVRERLRAAGLGGYRLQWKVPGHPDIAWPGKRVAIEVRGCFWHRCPHCNPSTPKKNTDYWQAKFARNIERDEENLRQLTDMGWRVHVIWECQLKKRTIDATMAKLLPELATELGKELKLAPNTTPEQSTKPHFMYVLECADGSLYTGYTPDVEARLAAHRAGTGAKYTRGRGPLNLLAVAQFATKHDAMSAEYRFKCLARDQKDALLAQAAKPGADFAAILREAFET